MLFRSVLVDYSDTSLNTVNKFASFISKMEPKIARSSSLVEGMNVASLTVNHGKVKGNVSYAKVGKYLAFGQEETVKKLLSKEAKIIQTMLYKKYADTLKSDANFLLYADIQKLKDLIILNTGKEISKEADILLSKFLSTLVSMKLVDEDTLHLKTEINLEK